MAVLFLWQAAQAQSKATDQKTIAEQVEAKESRN
jgi:hypothetical protein